MKTSDVIIIDMILTGSAIQGAIYADDCQDIEFFKVKILY